MNNSSRNYSDSIDLTEDEDNPGVHSEENSLFYFVDCSRNVDNASPPPLRPTLNIVGNSVTPSPVNVKQKGSVKSSNTRNIVERNTVQDYETINLDSDKEDSANDEIRKVNSVKHIRTRNTPKQDSFYSTNHPPGKVLTIKKNNKYYKIVIPHNVMPNINKSMGPVLINIPEVGPLVISNDPQASKEKFSHMKVQELCLNLDAIDKNQNSMTVMETTKQKNGVVNNKRVPSILSKSKNSTSKRCSTRLMFGFYNYDVMKATKCKQSMFAAITKLKMQLEDKILQYNRFKMSSSANHPDKDKVRLVKIDSIIRKNDDIITDKYDPTCNPLKIKENTYLQLDNRSEQYDSDLLMIKKTVNLNEENTEIPSQITSRPSTKKGKLLKYKVVKKPKRLQRSKTKKNRIVKPCYIKVTKDKKTEEALTRYYDNVGKLNATKRRQNKPRRKNNPAAKSAIPKPSNFTERLNEALTSKIIQQEKMLSEIIDTRKPLLVINEHTAMVVESVKYYYNELTKNNLVYCVRSNTIPNKILKNKYFVSAVELGYVKLVSAELLCKFISDGLVFPNI